MYAWYFDVIPTGMPLDGCHQSDDGFLPYLGIWPKGFSEEWSSRESTEPAHPDVTGIDLDNTAARNCLD